MNFGEAAREAGVERVVYLGGLGPTGEDASEHLRSRHEVAELLRQRVPEFVYVRAAMIIGQGSASFEMLRHLVTPPAGHDHPALGRHALAAGGDRRRGPRAGRRGRARATRPSEVQLGGADVLTYREMMARAAARARAAGRRRSSRCPSSRRASPRYWVSLVTPVETGLVRPLVDGLKSEMVVERRAARAGINERPLGFEDAVRAALCKLLNRAEGAARRELGDRRSRAAHDDGPVGRRALDPGGRHHDARATSSSRSGRRRTSSGSRARTGSTSRA